MQVDYAQCSSNMSERKEKVEAALERLRSLKCQVSELRAQCEALKKRESEKQVLHCRECGKVVNRDQEVMLKDSFGKVKGYYHKDCFKEIWRSENWRFDYSCPGFLRTSKQDYWGSFQPVSFVLVACAFLRQPKICIRNS